MNINFKQPKYILPLIILPFLCLFFYVYNSSSAIKKKKTPPQAGIQDNVGDVSSDIKNQGLTGKLDAFRNTYKEADGYTAVNPIGEEISSDANYSSPYSMSEKHMLDSIDQQMKNRFHSSIRAEAPLPQTYPGAKSYAEDKALAEALSGLSRQQPGVPSSLKTVEARSEPDPMELFKMQMAYMDSMSKASDPEYKAEKQRNATLAKAEAERNNKQSLKVSKSRYQAEGFNTVLPPEKDAFIMAIIDEDVTGYAGSRIRLRLLDDVYAGRILIKKGTYLYALINGFLGQRVTLSVQSVLLGNAILPVKLDVYDQDGLPGLYVPSSAFRDFTRDLSGNSMQGINIDGGAQNGSQFLMSTLDKMFQSTSSAIASAIRKNKARIKYSSYVYLIDPQAQQNAAQTHN